MRLDSMGERRLRMRSGAFGLEQSERRIHRELGEGFKVIVMLSGAKNPARVTKILRGKHGHGVLCSVQNEDKTILKAIDGWIHRPHSGRTPVYDQRYREPKDGLSDWPGENKFVWV